MILDHLPRLAQLCQVVEHLEYRNQHALAEKFAAERDALIQSMTAPPPAPQPQNRGKR